MKKTKNTKRTWYINYVLQPLLYVAVFTGIVILFYKINDVDESTARKKVIEHIRVDSTAPIQTNITDEQAMTLLKHYVETHPRQEISNHLYQLVADEKLFINFQTASTTLDQSGIATFYLSNIVDRGIMPVFGINPQVLQNKNISDNYKYCVLYHEYIHYLQWREKRVPEETFYLRSKNKTNRLTQETAYWLFEGESEAYRKEAILASELKCAELPLCIVEYQKSGIQGLRKGLALEYSSLPSFKIHQEYLQALAEKSPRFN